MFWFMFLYYKEYAKLKCTATQLFEEKSNAEILLDRNQKELDKSKDDFKSLVDKHWKLRSEHATLVWCVSLTAILLRCKIYFHALAALVYLVKPWNSSRSVVYNKRVYTPSFILCASILHLDASVIDYIIFIDWRTGKNQNGVPAIDGKGSN